MEKVVMPTDPAERKALPIVRGCLDYFPDALLAVAELSRVGNEQHNPGEPLHWAKEKSTDEADALVRHLIERGTIDTDGIRHSAKVAWRGLALLQREIDSERDAASSGGASPDGMEAPGGAEAEPAEGGGSLSARGCPLCALGTGCQQPRFIQGVPAHVDDTHGHTIIESLGRDHPGGSVG